MINIEKKEYNYFFRQLLFIVVVMGIGVIIWQQIGYLISSFLGAFTIYVVLRTPFLNLIEKHNWKPWAASLLMVGGTVLILLAIGFLVFEIVASEIPTVSKNIVINEFGELSDNINNYIGFSLLSDDIFTQFKDLLSNFVSEMLSATYNFVINFLLMILVLYFMLANARKMENTIMRYSIFSGKSMVMIKTEVKKMVFGNAVGIPIVMLAQAVVALIGYWIIGLDRMFFWAFLTAIFGLVPLVGTAAIWIPLAIFQFTTGNIWQGVVLSVYSLVVLANIDNVCRLVLMKIMADTHPLIVIFGVLLGIPLFGFWGIIFGPLLISGFLLLIKIYFSEYKEHISMQHHHKNNYDNE